MRRVAQRNPKSAEPQFWLGMMAVNNGFNTSGIRKYFTKCLSLCENYPDALAHYYMGMIHYTDEHYEDAAAAFNRYFLLANGSDRKEWTAVYEEASAYLHWSQFLADAELHRAPFDPEPLRGISSKYDEELPYITPDHSRCYYLREQPLKKDRTSFYTSTTAKTVWKLFYSDWNSADSAFDGGHEMPAPFNRGASEGAISTTADGKELYFARMTQNNSDIYCASLADNGQWMVDKVGNGINGDRSWESQPSVSADGLWLFFASNRPGGYGGTDIWRCHRLPNGDWSRPTNLGTRINTPGNEKAPFLHADGHTLYFVSSGWQGFGGYDVYFIDLADTNASCPTNLGLPINSEDDNSSFGVTTDGHHAYFSGRVATSRSKDILYFDLYPAARPEPMRLWQMQVTDTLGNPLPALVKTGNSNWTATANGSVCVMLSERHDNLLTVTAEGYMPYFFRLRAKDVAHGRNGKEISLVPMSANACEHLDLADNGVIEALAQWLIANPRARITIECPTKAEADKAYAALRLIGDIRPDRITRDSGTHITHKQIRLQ